MPDRRDPSKRRAFPDGRRWYTTGECAALMELNVKDGFVRGCIEVGVWSQKTGGLVKLRAIRIPKRNGTGEYRIQESWLLTFLEAIPWPIPVELKPAAGVSR